MMENAEKKRCSSQRRLQRENGYGEVKEIATQKSQAVKLAADRLLFVWGFFLQRLLGERHWPSGIYSQLKVVFKTASVRGSSYWMFAW